MEEFDTKWSRDELKTYILIYCAKADLEESKHETEFIISKSNLDIYSKMINEFEKDNDYQSIQKIKVSLEKHGYIRNEINMLYDEIKELFLSDGKYDILEQNLLKGLNYVFR